MSKSPPSINPGYVAGQIDKALLTAGSHDDPEVRARAALKLDRWLQVMGHVISGSASYGSRTPIADTPSWVTLDVATGGFATGNLLAGGDLRPHEIELMRQVSGVATGDERLALNKWFLGPGFDRLREWLHDGRYRIEVAEEGALLVVAWLAEHDEGEAARELLEVLSPWFNRLRFYPTPADRPASDGTRMHVQDVGSTMQKLSQLKPHLGVQAQKEAVLVWAPEYDAAVSLVLETVVEGEPGARITPDWANRVRARLDRYAELRQQHPLCKRPDDPRDHPAQVRDYLRTAIDGAKRSPALQARMRRILQRYLAKHGPPDSAQCRAQRSHAAAAIEAPLRHAFVAPLKARLSRYPSSEALSDPSPLLLPVDAAEAGRYGVPHLAPFPESLTRKIERCVEGTAEELIERGVVKSGDMLAEILPQMISKVRAAGAADESSRRLHAALYRAFRRRRSLLLLNLQNQVRIDELPWFAALERHCMRGTEVGGVARRTLEEVSAITLGSFPFAIVPNKLLQELVTLAKDAGLDIPLTEELAVDIFMGRFSAKFVAAAHVAADLLKNSLYATYYGIESAELRTLRAVTSEPRKSWFFQRPTPDDPLNDLCRRRAGLAPNDRGIAANGMVLEQQQVLTTQNLAALFQGLGLANILRGELPGMTRRCFEWICDRQQTRYPDRHSYLIMLKNTAYAWRQMIFWLSVMDSGQRAASFSELQRLFEAQPERFRARFGPALLGLKLANQGRHPDQEGGRLFLGWTIKPHWLMPEKGVAG